MVTDAADAASVASDASINLTCLRPELNTGVSGLTSPAGNRLLLDDSSGGNIGTSPFAASYGFARGRFRMKAAGGNGVLAGSCRAGSSVFARRCF